MTDARDALGVLLRDAERLTSFGSGRLSPTIACASASRQLGAPPRRCGWKPHVPAFPER